MRHTKKNPVFNVFSFVILVSTGRTRSNNGISILLAMPNVIRQERVNCERVKLMEASLAKITEMSSAQMSQNVQAYQGELFKEWDLKALAEEENRRKMENVNFRVVSYANN